MPGIPIGVEREVSVALINFFETLTQLSGKMWIPHNQDPLFLHASKILIQT